MLGDHAARGDGVPALRSGAHRDPRLLEVTLALSTAALEVAGFAYARRRVEEALHSGKALDHFGRMVSLLGGPEDFVERMDAHLDIAPIVRDVPAPTGGVVKSIDTRAVGMGVVTLGGGRRLPTDGIDYAVGFDRLMGLGSRMEPGMPLARVHARTEAAAEEASARLVAAYTLGDTAPSHPLIADRVDPPGLDMGGVRR